MQTTMKSFTIPFRILMTITLGMAAGVSFASAQVVPEEASADKTAEAETNADDPLTARNVTDAVEREFAHDPAVPLNDIDISTHDNVVVLEGRVPTLRGADYAVRLAETVRGVRSVVDELSIEPHWARADWEVERAAEYALLNDATADAYELEVDVTDGVATVTGQVDSWQEKRLAGRVVKGVRGVLELNNDVEVVYDSKRPDSEVRADVQSRLRWDTLVDHTLIEVGVTDGEVDLSGVVGSAAEKRRARSDAWVAGTVDVDSDELSVERWARDPDLRTDKYEYESVQQVENAIEDALLYDSRVNMFDIAVDFDGAEATLRGQVDNLAARRAAERVARNTVGVVSVENRIKVRPERQSDERTLEQLEQKLREDPYVTRFEIEVDVVGGKAWLDGLVDHPYEKMRAEQIAASTHGVTAVRNRLEVDTNDPMLPDPYVSPDHPYRMDWYDYVPGDSLVQDSAIKADIESELWWSPFVTASDINVIVQDGTATLTGTVDTYRERRNAAEEAYEGGAVWVRNRLEVENGAGEDTEQP